MFSICRNSVPCKFNFLSKGYNTQNIRRNHLQIRTFAVWNENLKTRPPEVTSCALLQKSIDGEIGKKEVEKLIDSETEKKEVEKRLREKNLDGEEARKLMKERNVDWIEYKGCTYYSLKHTKRILAEAIDTHDYYEKMPGRTFST